METSTMSEDSISDLPEGTVSIEDFRFGLLRSYYSVNFDKPSFLQNIAKTWFQFNLALKFDVANQVLSIMNDEA